MSIATAIINARTKIESAFAMAEACGAKMPETRDLSSLVSTVRSLFDGNLAFYKEYSSVTGQYELTPIKSITAGDVITLKEGSDIAAANSGTDMYNPDLVFEEWSCPLEITDGTITIPEDFYGDLIIVASYHTQDGLDHYIDNSGNDTTTNPGSSVLKRVYFSNSVTTIENFAFYFCSNLTSITLPNSLTTIGDEAFRDCQSLPSITLPNSVTTIGECAFEGCSKLTSITLPNSLTTIGEWAFSWCISLTSITIPNSVTTIGNSAFYDCGAMREYIFNSTTPPTLSSTDVFANIPSDCKIYVPNESVDAYKQATNWSEYAAYITPISQRTQS